jgi:outer membrane protein assembly factor BamB
MHGATGGGMPGGGAPTGDIQGVMGSTMGEMMSGFVVGPDGTAYLLRTTTSTAAGSTQQTRKAELIAVNPQTGRANWKLQIDGTMVSTPVLGKDGSIYLTTSELPMLTTAVIRKPALVIVAPGATSARVQNRVEIASDLLSVPQISPDGQTVYVVTTDMPEMGNGLMSTTMAVDPTLYAFSPSGALKFKVQLSQL